MPVSLLPVEELEGPEYTRVWDRFRQHFSFRPSMRPRAAIAEPVDSVTWSLDALDDDPEYLALDAMVEALNAGLWACTPADGTLLVLDWQHACYRIRPHLMTAELAPRWPRSMMPDGDYNIHLAEDFSYGTFGHPWESTICVLGSGLLERVADIMDSVLLQRVREGGRPLGEMRNVAVPSGELDRLR
ncbi:DUF2716 domain-containing protein [Actinoplanes sp. NPDC051859]|uniref:DUF2716 domain-containing protein n=1 Tax=Actinoplanes sp. NPDC051859 TaxID=3363909 RepID=UPI0037898D65